jgi:hypothetical protein
MKEIDKRKGQHIARFEDGEIDFLIEREFPEKAQEVRNKFSGLKEFWINSTRTKAAILKLSEGNFEKVKELIKKANTDPRDVIGYAEYPSSMKMDWTEQSKMTEEERQEMDNKDWEQYQEWKNRGK